MTRTNATLCHIGLIALMTAGAASSAASQAVTQEDVLDAWDVMTEMVVASARAMPAEHFEFSPGEPLRTFADQLNHTTQSNLGFSQSVNAGAPSFAIPDQANPPREKAAVIDLLEKSFAHFRLGLTSLTDEDLGAEVPWGPRTNRRMITRLKAVLIVTSHLQREHGKTIMYLRARGITPPPSGSWSF